MVNSMICKDLKKKDSEIVFESEGKKNQISLV